MSDAPPSLPRKTRDQKRQERDAKRRAKAARRSPRVAAQKAAKPSRISKQPSGGGVATAARIRTSSVSTAPITETIALGPRIMPPGARHVLGRNLHVFRSAWLVIMTGLFEPVFYLWAVGIGVGALVGDVTGPGGAPVPYAEFVAPGMLAASAMNGAVYESTINIYFRLKHDRIYDAMLATPVNPHDIAAGEVATSLVRGGGYTASFLLIAWASGLVASPWALLSLPIAGLIGIAFGALGMAATTWMRSWQDFDLVQIVTMPLFLFSATFYPLDVYPPSLRVVAQISPLYHGAELMRAAFFGVWDWSVPAHVAVLAALAVFGVRVASRRISGLLLT